jgi:hypothetical protein
MAENMVRKIMAVHQLVARQPQILGFAHLEIRSFGGLFGALYCCYHSSIFSASKKGHERMRRPKSHVRRQYFQRTRRLIGPVFSPWRSRLRDEMRGGRIQITLWNVMEDSYASLHAKEWVPWCLNCLAPGFRGVPRSFPLLHDFCWGSDIGGLH